MRRRLAGNHGGVTTFVVVLVVPMMAVAGLAYDGGRMLAARREAVDVAQQASVAGSQAIAYDAVRQGRVDVDIGEVKTASHRYLSSVGYAGTVHVTDTEVIVEVTATVEMKMLSMVGVGSRSVSGQAATQLARGVDTADVRRGGS